MYQQEFMNIEKLDALSHEQLDKLDEEMVQEHLEFENLLHKLEKGIITESELDKLGEHIFKVEMIL